MDALTRPTPPYADESFGFGKGKQPLISVGHHAAMEYARWLSKKTGKVVDIVQQGSVARLPHGIGRPRP